MNQSEKDLIYRISEEYKNKGYKIYFHNFTNIIPFDLGGYRPDLIAIKDNNDGYIFEIKSSKSNISVDQLKEVASSTDSNDGWHFILVTGDDVSFKEKDLGFDTNKIIPSWEQIISNKNNAEKLLVEKEYNASFLMFWITLEALMRKHAEDLSIPIYRLPTSSLIKHLYSEGELSITQFDKIKPLTEIRNQINHGFQVNNISKSTVDVNSILDELIKEWQADKSQLDSKFSD